MKKTIITVLILLTLAGCTSKDLYQYGQNHQKQECLKHAESESQLAECHTQEKKSFEDYSKERKKLDEK